MSTHDHGMPAGGVLGNQVEHLAARERELARENEGLREQMQTLWCRLREAEARLEAEAARPKVLIATGGEG